MNEIVVTISCENGHQELRRFMCCSEEWLQGLCARYNEQKEPCGVCDKPKTATLKKDEQK